MADLKVIHITRDHLLHAYADRKLDGNERVHIDTHRFKEYCEEILLQEAQVNSLFKKALVISYEQLMTDFDAESKKILRFLGADDTISLIAPPVLEYKPLWEKVDNYKQVVKDLYHSPYLSRIA